MNCPLCQYELAEPLPPSLDNHWQAIKGNLHAKRASEVALAGLHTIGFIGQPENGREHFTAVLGELAQWVARCNCGYFDDPYRECVCLPEDIAAWRQRPEYRAVTACDLVIDVVQPKARDLLGERPQEPFGDVLVRIARARTCQTDNLLDSSSRVLLENVITRLGFTPRRVEQVKAVALTIARFEGSSSIQARHIAEAIQYGYMENAL